jgi:hypothetical protein
MPNLRLQRSEGQAFKSAQSNWWVSEIEGKAAKGSGERVGKRASFNSADAFIRVIRGCFALTQRCNF